MAVSYNTVTVNATATLILGANPDRRGFIIQNLGIVTVYLGFDSSVSTANGISILANGSYVNSGSAECYRGDYYGIAASSTADCRYEEWTP
jgi:hypothetical protein